MPEEKREAAIVLVKAIYKMAFIPIETIIHNLKKSFYDIGGTSLNTISLLVYLNKKGYSICKPKFFIETHTHFTS